MLYLETKEICLCWPVSLCQKSIPHWGFVIIPKFLLYFTFLNVCNPLKWRLGNSEIKEPSCGKSFICWLQKHLKFFFTAKVFFLFFSFFFPFFSNYSSIWDIKHLLRFKCWKTVNTTEFPLRNCTSRMSCNNILL